MFRLTKTCLKYKPLKLVSRPFQSRFLHSTKILKQDIKPKNELDYSVLSDENLKKEIEIHTDILADKFIKYFLENDKNLMNIYIIILSDDKIFKIIKKLLEIYIINIKQKLNISDENIVKYIIEYIVKIGDKIKLSKDIIELIESILKQILVIIKDKPMSKEEINKEINAINIETVEILFSNEEYIQLLTKEVEKFILVNNDSIKIFESLEKENNRRKSLKT